jgi:hypothetical protein
LEGNPQFVDINGINNILGFVGGVDGGQDDNWTLSRNSPGIDRGQSWSSQLYDAIGSTRLDDASILNEGSPIYEEQAMASNVFEETGVAKNWRSNDSHWQLNLPFAFPYFGTNYSSVWVSNKGFLQFGTSSEISASPSLEVLQRTRRIAPMWDNLTTLGTGNDIFVDTTLSGQINIRWRATHLISQSPVNVSVTLYDNGEFRFSYGSGNEGISPIIGYSSGRPDLFHNFRLASINALNDLGNHPGLQFALAPGFVDIGAFEFRGDSGDQTPPLIVSSVPSAVHGQSTTAQDISQIRLNFSEEMNYFDANAYSAYDLRTSGLNGVFGDADDILYALVPEYQLGATYVNLGIIDGPLPHGNYRLTLPSTVASSIRDTAGLRMDGNNDGMQGGDYVRFFSIADVAQVIGSHVYHRGSAFDSGDISLALDTGKRLSKEEESPKTLTFENLINSSRGITGLVFDFQNLPVALSTSDFVFQWSPQGAFTELNNLPQNWLLAPNPIEIETITGPTDRVVLEWPNNAIANRWLRVTVLANANTGLAAPEVYYIGHLLGETTGATNGIYTVAFADITPIRSSVGQTIDSGGIADIDKNGTVSFADISAMRSNVGAQLTNITIPAAGNTGGQTLLSSGGGNERPKKGDLRGIHFDDSWPLMVPLIDEVHADFSSRITEKVNSQWLRREDSAVTGIGHAVIGHAVTAELSARRETAAVDWVFSAMGGRSGRSEVIAELELEDALEEVELLALGTLERSSWFPPK